MTSEKAANLLDAWRANNFGHLYPRENRELKRIISRMRDPNPRLLSILEEPGE